MNIYDIAKEAGVSVSTVSRVLNDYKNLREDTRQKVQAVLDKYNYVPSPIARGLVHKSLHTIGLVAFDIRGTHYAPIAYAVEQEFSSLGYSCILCSTGAELSAQGKYIEVMAKNHLDGLIFIGSTFQSDYVKKCIKKHLSNIPVVMANAFLDEPNVYGVLCDDEKGILDGVELLYKKGHRQIAFVNSGINDSSHRKENGYLSGVHKYDPEPIKLHVENTIQGGKEAARAIIKSYPQVTATIFGLDTTAVGGVREFQNMQLKIPEEMEVIGYDNSSYCEICFPSLTSVDTQLEPTGILVARLLHDAICNKKTVHKIVLSPHIVERETTGKADNK